MQQYDKKWSQKVSKRVMGFPGWRPWGRLGRPLTPQSVFEHTKVYPKCSKNHLQGAKVTTKCFKSDPQGRKMHSYRSAKVVQVHQKMPAARYQARRTVRSAFNKTNKPKQNSKKQQVHQTSRNIIAESVREPPRRFEVQGRTGQRGGVEGFF